MLLTSKIAGVSLATALERFKDYKLGLFIHWGGFLFDQKSVLNDFTAEAFNAKAWVEMAVKGGCAYLCVTAKHHDGFCIFDSKQTDYTSMHAPAHKDFIACLAQACREQEIPLFLYYSLHDLHHPKAIPGNENQYQAYVQYMLAQLRELCTQYGDVAGFWLDQGPYHQGPQHPYQLDQVKRLLRDLQPLALIMGDDYYESEKTILPSYRPFGLAGEKPLEVCDTLGHSWSYQDDDPLKSDAELIENLVRVAAAGGNYLLNVGPRPSGCIDPRHALKFEKLGAWLRENGSSIYGTRPFKLEWTNLGLITGRCYATADANHIYLHLFNWTEDAIHFDKPGRAITDAYILNGPVLDFQAKQNQLIIRLPESCRQQTDTIVVLAGV